MNRRSTNYDLENNKIDKGYGTLNWKVSLNQALKLNAFIIKTESSESKSRDSSVEYKIN